MISEKKSLSSVIFRSFGCFEHQKFSLEEANIPNQNYSVRVDSNTGQRRTLSFNISRTNMTVAGGLAKEVYETQQMLLLCDIFHSRKLVWNLTIMLCSQRLWAEWRTSRSLIPPPAPWRCAGNRRRATSGSTASSTCPRPEAPRTWLEITPTSCLVMCQKELGISSDRQSRFTSAHLLSDTFFCISGII